MSLIFIINKSHSLLQKKESENDIFIIKQAVKHSSQFWCSHCHYSKNRAITNNSILLIGDSHLEHWIPAMLHYTKKHGIDLHYFYYHLKSSTYNTLYKLYFPEKRFKWLLIILGFYTSKIYLEDNISDYIVDVVNYALKYSDKVLYIEDIPKLKRNNICLQCYEKHIKECYAIEGVNITTHPRLIKEMNRVKYISFNNIICNKNICPCIYNKISIYDTMSHLSPQYTKTFYKYFDNLFFELISISSYKNTSNPKCSFYIHGKYFYRRC